MKICVQCGLPNPKSNPYCFCGPRHTVDEWVKRTVDAMFAAAERAAKLHSKEGS